MKYTRNVSLGKSYQEILCAKKNPVAVQYRKIPCFCPHQRTRLCIIWWGFEGDFDKIYGWGPKADLVHTTENPESASENIYTRIRIHLFQAAICREQSLINCYIRWFSKSERTQLQILIRTSRSHSHHWVILFEKQSQQTFHHLYLLTTIYYPIWLLNLSFHW